MKTPGFQTYTPNSYINPPDCPQDHAVSVHPQRKGMGVQYRNPAERLLEDSI